MHIAHIIDSLGRGGAETLLVGVLNGMPEHQHTVITLDDRNDFKGEILEGINFISLNHNRPSQIIATVFKLKKILNKIKPDILHSTLYTSTVIAKLACPEKIKLIFSLQITQGDEFYEKKKWMYLLDKYTYRKRHTAISATKTVADDFEKWIGFKGKNYILYNTFDMRYYNSRPRTYSSKRSYNIVLVGNLKEQKNYFFLLDALKLLNSSLIKCDIFGFGPLEAEIKSRIEKDSLNVTLKGQSRNLWDILPEYDIYVMCSKREGFGIAAAEAMACGLPVLLSDIPVLREISENQAVYFDPNVPQNLADIFLQILDGKIDLQKLSDKARITAKKYSYREYLVNLNSIYKNVIGSGFTNNG